MTTNSLLRSPWLWFTLGAAAGYYAYKHRKDIVALTSRATDMGRDYMQQGKESLEDLLEEAREAEEAGPGGAA